MRATGSRAEAKADTFDYVIVGAGSAGCVLANRLSADPEISVLLIEAGPADHGWQLAMPSAFAYPLASRRFNWGYETEPEPFMDGRRMACPRGRVLGGSSSINGMVYIRGHARDYDRWAQAGLRGWSYSEVLPYFKRSETHEAGGDLYHGDNGPLYVSPGRMKNRLYRAFVEAGVEAGYPETADLNGFQQEGFGPMEMTVRHGRRCSAARAYLRPVLGRSNLTVITRALATRILMEGRRAVGVEYQRHRRRHQVRARREVLVCGGAINSPQLLMLSGIGPADALAQHRIPVVADLPGVGANLQDHLEIYVQHAATQPVTLYSAMKPLAKLAIGATWMLHGRGLGATNHFEAGAFIRSHAGIEHPNLQYHFLPLAISYDGSAAHKGHGFQAHVGPMRATSAGWVRLRSADPRDPPLIRFNYMETAMDRAEMRAAVRLTREIFAQKAFDPYRGPELAPGPEVKTNAEIDAFVRRKAESAYHPSCTCKMGRAEDQLAVVDETLRVHGMEQLRVVDASIMPSIVSGNLNAPTIMIGERAADLILGRKPLPAEPVPIHIAANWQEAQR